MLTKSNVSITFQYNFCFNVLYINIMYAYFVKFLYTAFILLAAQYRFDFIIKNSAYLMHVLKHMQNILISFHHLQLLGHNHMLGAYASN